MNLITRKNIFQKHTPTILKTKKKRQKNYYITLKILYTPRIIIIKLKKIELRPTLLEKNINLRRCVRLPLI